MAFRSRCKNISVKYWVPDFRHSQKAFHSLLPSILPFLASTPSPLFFPFAGHLLGFISEEEVFGKAFKRILGLDFSIHCVIVFFPFLWPPWLKHTNHHLSSSLLLHKLEDVKLSLPVKTDDITISKTRDVDPQRCLVTGSSGANGLKMKGFRWNSWDCNTTWYPLFNALLLFTVGLSIIPLRFDCMTIFLVNKTQGLLTWNNPWCQRLNQHSIQACHKTAASPKV